jgi:molybdopterin molybdotransferase
VINDLIGVEEALDEILSHVRPLAAERVPILEALGRVLAEEIVSDVNIPPFDNSAMDGFAVRSDDVVGATPDAPVRLRVIGSVAAGYVAEMGLEPGSALRIMTGAPLPGGADAVVPIEKTNDAERPKQARLAAPSQEILVRTAAAPRDHVRQAGEDIRLGELVIAGGHPIRPQEIGVLASLGRETVLVHRRPKVAILATGDELLDIYEPLAPGKIRNSNEFTNAALVARCGGIPLRLGIARDSVADLTAKLRSGLEQGADLFLTSGGVSVGDYDVVKDVLGAEGQMQFWQVNMKPGKPLAFGLLPGDVPLIGLPGNPVSAMVSFEQFARPAILKMLGHTDLTKPVVRAVLDEPLTNSGRRGFVRAVVTRRDGVYHARTTGQQGSGVLTSMARANGLAIVPEGTYRLESGSGITVQMLDWPEGTFTCTEVPVISVVGKSGVGKTTALERIISELRARGFAVGTVKHDTHGFEVDKPGKDSWRHAQAGSEAVVISGPSRMALIRQLAEEMPLDDLVPIMGNVDLVITEGYKRGDKPKIEVTRRERGTDLLCRAEELLAIMTDHPVDMNVPQFALDDAAGIVNLLEELFLRDIGEVEA